MTRRNPYSSVGVKHVVTAPRKQGGSWTTCCRCGWSLSTTQPTECEDAGNAHLRENAEENDDE